MRYGLPYKGSKNAIARWLVEQLPKADTFLDLFFGGGAVTHAAMLSGKWRQFVVNDIDGRLPKLFIECAYGLHTTANHREWISREEFHRLKDKDAYIALVWSFGNNGKDYIYGADIEEFKHAYHDAVFQDKPEYLKPWGYEIKSSHKIEPYDRYIEFNRQIKFQLPQMQLENVSRQIEIERLQRLQSLQSLQRLQRLQSLQSDYREVQISDGALIYCDPPYKDTNCGKYDGFDHEAFYEWAAVQDNIYISEYQMPDDFIPIANTDKIQLSAANSNDYHITEYLFTNRRTYNKMTKQQKELIRLNNAEQLTLF